MIYRRYCDGGYRWRALRLWPSSWWVTWCFERIRHDPTDYVEKTWIER